MSYNPTIKKYNVANDESKGLLLTPQSIEAEQAALGCVLLEPSCAEQFVAALYPDDFYYEPHRHIAAAIHKLHGQGSTADLITVADELKRAGKLDDCGGVPYLMRLAETPPSVTNLNDYIARVKQAATQRHLIRLLMNSAQVIAQSDSDLPINLAGLIQQLQSIANTTMEDTTEPITAEALVMETSAVEWLAEPLLPKGGILLIAGAAGVGKSSLALWMAVRMAEGKLLFETDNPAEMMPTKPCKVLIIDLENPRELVAQRFQTFGTPPGLLWWQPPQGIDLLRPDGVMRLEKVIRDCQPDVVILDALVRFHNTDENQAKEMKRVFEPLNVLRRKHGVAFIVLHHNRKAMPWGSSADAVRGSTEIMAVPDVVLVIRRPASSNTIVAEIVKSRHTTPTFVKFRVALEQADGGVRFVWRGTTEDAETALENAVIWVKEQLEQAPTTMKRLMSACGKAGITQRTLRRAVQRLEQDGAIVSWTAPNPDGKGKVKWLKLAEGDGGGLFDPQDRTDDDPDNAPNSDLNSVQNSVQVKTHLDTKGQYSGSFPIVTNSETGIKGQYSADLAEPSDTLSDALSDAPEPSDALAEPQKPAPANPSPEPSKPLSEPLFCPACGTPLDPEPDGTAGCVGCGRGFQVRDGRLIACSSKPP